jgi:hypothetical protein
MTTKPTDDEMRLLSTPQAKDLGELRLLADDLGHGVHALRILVEVYVEREFTPAERVIRLSLYRDALVQFVACFDGSTPLFLKVSEVYAGDPNAQSYFDSLKALRDTFAAYRHGPSRQCAVGVVASAQGPLGTGYISVRFDVPELEELKHTHDFILKTRRHVLQRVTELDKHVTADAMAMTREQILALPGAHGYNVQTHEMRLSRERFARERARKDRMGPEDRS